MSNPGLDAASLDRARQEIVLTEWLDRLAASATKGDARNLYIGRGFALGLAAAAAAEAPLFVVSAGLGLVQSRREVPAYGLTVGSRADDSVAARVEGRFDPQAWWAGVRTGPFSTGWNTVFAQDGLVLMALSQAYARMIAADLAALDGTTVGRLRLFGIGIEAVLPKALASQIMPYDARFDTLHPGTRTDFAQRALAHFAGSVPFTADPDADAASVRRALAGHLAPRRVDRPRADDEHVIGAITRHLENGTGIGRILRQVRDEDRIACEQRRFTRLYRIAQSRTGTSASATMAVAGSQPR